MNSLGFDKPAGSVRIAVAMSGGVDSSAVAALLLGQGYDVFGVTLLLCAADCSSQHDAVKVAEKLGIEHRFIDCRDQFARQVIDAFADSYLRGETPIPCAVCNKRIKFGRLLDEARAMGADALATGHYARLEAREGRTRLLRAADAERDQSYFLFLAAQEQLDFLRFPLGGVVSKSETRAIAEKFGLPVASKPDSQDICFVPDGDYAGLVRSLRPGAIEAGDIVHEQGHVLGRHDGIIDYTVGQRRGLNFNRAGDHNSPLYVLRIDAEKRQVVVGERAALAQKEVVLRDMNWLGERVPEGGIRVGVKLRSAQPPLAAVFFMRGDGRGLVALDEPAFGVAPGQAGVIYDGDVVLGGGWIAV